MAIEGGADTLLGRTVLEGAPDATTSGFRLLPLPRFALHAREEMVRRAQRSIDVQYYLIEDDATGRFLLRALRDASRRGVRVRILVDDFYTASSDDLLLALSAYPNIEVRLFNPFPAGRGSLFSRFATSIFDLERVNRRMHNKLLLADNVAAIAGGRNIANGYFQHDATSSFIDMDVFAVGPIVPKLSSYFDLFWNSEQVYPIESLVPAAGPPAELRDRFDAMTRTTAGVADQLDATDLLGHRPLGLDLDAGAAALRLTWAQAEAFSDMPSKVLAPSYPGRLLTEADRHTVLYNVRRLVRAAQSEVVETMPYLVPGPEGMESIRGVRARDVKFSIVTNSLAAADEPLVHAGYRRYRSRLLRLGVDLYELSPRDTANASRFGTFGAAGGRLHGKLVVIDRKIAFVGSMNFDPRSDSQNTELGLFIYSTEIAQQIHGLILGLQRTGAYLLRLDPSDSRIEWLSPEDSTGVRRQVFHNEPETTLWERMKLELLAPLIPESIL
ncbi:phospholipase D family protein [Variovorax sp. WS11]|uniref:phospholipase D family protein n=1 Tax=Variovorax sp. WS11 TaxID=1105204 RepID=UPI001EF1A559|nr:phospholipase D family protein [Variovorax sp. WS11]